MPLTTIESIIEDISTARYFPSATRISCNDKDAESLFQKDSLKNKRMHIRETKNFGEKQEKIVTSFQILGIDSLNEFDRAVLDVCISEQIAGNCYTTISAIFRALIGQVGNKHIAPSKNQKDAIIQTVKKLMTAAIFSPDLADNLNKLGYTKAKDDKTFELKAANILPAVLLEETTCRVNGNDVENVLYFHALSPFFNIADAKNQIVRYPHELFNVPKQNNTPRIISLKSYVMRRIAEIKLHKQLVPTITFEDVFKKCRVADKDSQIIRRSRDAILQFFEHLQTLGEIKSFEITKKRGKFYAVKFTF